MIESHFGLRRRAFPGVPDHSCYYASSIHETAAGRILAGLSDGEGFLLITGAPGIGKTLLCACLLDRLGNLADMVFLTHTHFHGKAGLLQAILYDLSLPHEGRGEQEMRLAIIDQLLARFQTGRKTILVIDEAQHLSPELLEELRLLGNLEGPAGKVVQVVLVAQPDILSTLQRADLASFRQRLAVRVHLEALGIEEAADYLLHHLRTAGGQPDEILDAEAMELIARQTHGVPRLLNQAAHQAMRLAAESGSERIDVEIAIAALDLLGLAPLDENEAPLVTHEPIESADEDTCRLFLAPGQSA